MDLECLRIREGGTKVELGSSTYHFKPRVPDGRHVATVTDEAHRDTLLGISAYRIAPALAVLTGTTAIVAPEPIIEDASVDLDGDQPPAEGAKEAAQEAADTADATEAPAKPEEAATAPETTGSAPVSEPGTASPYDAMDRDELATAFEARFGRKPHPQTALDTLRAKLMAPVEA